LQGDCTQGKDKDTKLQEVLQQGESFHQARLHSVLTGIAECKRKQLKVNHRIATILDD